MKLIISLIILLRSYYQESSSVGAMYISLLRSSEGFETSHYKHFAPRGLQFEIVRSSGRCHANTLEISRRSFCTGLIGR